MARDTVTVPREVLANAVSELKSLLAMCEGEVPSLLEDHFSYPKIVDAIEAGETALSSSDPEGGARGVQGSIATKQESRPESAPRTETAVREALPFGIIDPKYAAFYTVARLTAWSYGYAIAMHGSFTRDLDLIAIPWTDAAVSPEKLIHQIQYRTGCTPVKPNASIREHGRIVWTLSFPEFDCPRFVDFSIIPPVRLDTQLTKTPSAGHDDGNLRGLAEQGRIADGGQCTEQASQCLSLADFDHLCTDRECPIFGQRSCSSNCRCHKTREQMMLDEINRLRKNGVRE